MLVLLNSPSSSPCSGPISVCCSPFAPPIGGANVSCFKPYMAYCPGSPALSLASSHGWYVLPSPEGPVHNLKMAIAGSVLGSSCSHAGMVNEIHSWADACGDAGSCSHDQSMIGPVRDASSISSSFSSRSSYDAGALRFRPDARIVTGASRGSTNPASRHCAKTMSRITLT